MLMTDLEASCCVVLFLMCVCAQSWSPFSSLWSFENSMRVFTDTAGPSGTQRFYFGFWGDFSRRCIVFTTFFSPHSKQIVRNEQFLPSAIACDRPRSLLSIELADILSNLAQLSRIWAGNGGAREAKISQYLGEDRSEVHRVLKVQVFIT